MAFKTPSLNRQQRRRKGSAGPAPGGYLRRERARGTGRGEERRRSAYTPARKPQRLVGSGSWLTRAKLRALLYERECVRLAGPKVNTENSFENFLMAYRADVGKQASRRPEFSGGLVLLHQLRWGREQGGTKLGELPPPARGVGVQRGRAGSGPPPAALSCRPERLLRRRPGDQRQKATPLHMVPGERDPPRSLGPCGGSPQHRVHVRDSRLRAKEVPEEKLRCAMLGCQTHFLWALSFLALVLFFRAWSASTAGKRDG